MAESRRGGPVKPPTLDLSANKADKTDANISGDAQGSEKPAGDTSSKAPPKPEASAKPAENKPAEDNKGTTGPAAPGMTSGAQDKTAKPGADAKSSASGDTPSADKPRDPPPAPHAASSNAGGLIAATLLGAVIGLGGAYALAAAGYWPGANGASVSDAVAENDAAITALSDEMSSLSERLNQQIAGLEQSIADSSSAATAGYDGAIAEIETSLSEQSDRLDALTEAAANGETGDAGTQIAALSDQLSQLTARLDALESADPGDAVADLDARLAELASEVSTLESAQSELGSELSTTDQRLADLGSRFDEAEASREPVTDAIQLPLALSGLETAFASGRAYSGELSALTQSVPTLEIPDVIMTRAADGLPDPDRVARSLDAVIPAMLAAKPSDPGASWSDRAMEQARNLLALRPADEIEGDTPDALISQLEASVERRNFTAAAEALSALPEPMREAAGETGANILTLGTAEDFATAARRAALSEVETAQ